MVVAASKLDTLPPEITHQILSYLPPASLVSVRAVCKSLSSAATSNYHWQTHSRALWESRISLKECRDSPQKSWAFSLVNNGWFRAYTTILRIAHNAWLRTDAELDDTLWMVFFKSIIIDDVWPVAWHALVECNSSTKIVSALDGLPLNPSRWYVDDRPSFRVTGYPPNVPSRDPITWCRIMQHISVLMVSDAPEFLDGLLELEDSIIAESASRRVESSQCLSEFSHSGEPHYLGQSRERLMEKRKVTNRERLIEILLNRAYLQRGYESDQGTNKFQYHYPPAAS